MMKKQICISALFLILTTSSVLLFRSMDDQLEKVTVQTGFRFVEEFKMTGVIIGAGTTRAKWVEDKNKKANSISFYADASTVIEIVNKLKASIKNDPNNLDSDGRKKKLVWVFERGEESLYLRLVKPGEQKRKTSNNGC